MDGVVASVTSTKTEILPELLFWQYQEHGVTRLSHHSVGAYTGHSYVTSFPVSSRSVSPTPVCSFPSTRPIEWKWQRNSDCQVCRENTESEEQTFYPPIVTMRGLMGRGRNRFFSTEFLAPLFYVPSRHRHPFVESLDRHATSEVYSRRHGIDIL